VFTFVKLSFGLAAFAAGFLWVSEALYAGSYWFFLLFVNAHIYCNALH